MAIYHFTVTVISRARGQRVVAAAAASSAAKLRDEYYGVTHNHLRRPGVEFTAIAAPVGVPAWVFDRAQLWNRVEAGEKRVDAQLARALEISLPSELQPQQRVELLREFVQAQFIARGMIADMSIRRTALGHANAHLLLTLREAHAEGFGPKKREWNRKGDLMIWRRAWADAANLHLARAGHAVRIDHRSYEAQQLELTPARRTGIGRSPADTHTLPDYLQARFEEQRRIAHDNGAAILEDPTLAIRTLSRQKPKFTLEEMRGFLSSRTDGQAQLEAALTAVRESAELVALSGSHYTSRDLLEAHKALVRRAKNMSRRGDFAAVAVPSGALQEYLEQVRGHWQQRGKQLRPDALGAGEPLSANDVLFVQDAELIDLKTLERHVEAAERARAAVLLVADAGRLESMGALSPLHELLTPSAG